ncbi:MAG: hypothetical protein DCF12_19205 [Snowella sp.]|jgi:hypothetical protein|nr:MAG: hypothetical protein DCF12_19205 [Snowella sp.]
MDNQELLNYLVDIPFTFHQRPTPLEPQFRVIWGLSILVLILYICSRGKKSSVSRLHFLSWAVRSAENRENLIELLENRHSPLAALVQYDPSFDRAIKYALAEKLVETDNGKTIRLAPNGLTLVQQIIQTENCLKEEKDFLTQKAVLVTETQAKIFLTN